MPKKLVIKKADELVMCVARKDLFEDGIWSGIKSENLQKYINLISKKHKFLPRGKVETDPAWQQIIPYLVFENDSSIFVMKRKASHTESRLANMYSIGIGGHVNKSDLGSRGIISWARREFEEEVDYKGKYKTEFLGLLNDDSTDVNMVHLGLVIKIKGESKDIAVRDEYKSGVLVELGKAKRYYKRMEIWSRIVYDYLTKMSQRVKVPKSQSNRTTNMIMGILPDWAIEDYINKGLIKIEPLEKNWRENIDQVSVDFHLGTSIKLFRAGAYRFVDTKRGLPDDAMEEVNLNDGDPFILEPGAFAIASTREVLTLPGDVLGRLEGKSSLARLGILVHSTAARFDPGWDGAPVLELGNLGPKPAILYCGMPICAFTFEKLAAPVKMSYAGSRSDRYSGSRKAVASRIHKHVKR